MKILGLITEYNPFHNGHYYHLQQSRSLTDPDLTIVIMSGDFLQRGEPALISKWDRAKAAVRSGVDLVFELPYQYAVQPADRFAKGAVRMLADTGVTDVVFGSEHGISADFTKAASMALQYQDQINKNVRKNMQSGERFPKAYANAVHEASGKEIAVDLSHPNNSLGFHYTLEAMKMASQINMHTIKRAGAGYHNPELQTGSFSSATAIRGHLLTEGTSADSISQAVPETMMEIIRQSIESKTLASWKDFYPFLQYKLLTTSNEALSAIYDCDEGLENRLKKNAKEPTFTEFLKAVSTKRYTNTKIQRLLVHLLSNVQKSEMEKALSEPPAFRLLAMNTKGRNHLNHLKHKDIDIVAKQFATSGCAASIHNRVCDVYGIPHINNPYFREEHQRTPYLHENE
ncbi:nucleotidyltransferase [Salisediminibacterium selenitireducens]|uniref:tRNA(Met) cytidine acetate ligase n=1 Tax=Bacillus selenitireducens (strain ATCC 700615 / DSM 15326 / MLS10) TaxID=439292 RepID=D6XTL0_BACIE|nr:nucleotidyltransferase [Salisediminibacterium selenitireducens]ADH99146.1 protein of unknown function DUF795 [[Bacillus] selenitireducens MLS10]